MVRDYSKYNEGELVEEREYTQKIAYDASNNPIYVGYATPGTSTSESKWKIQKITYDASNNPTDVQYPNGDSGFNYVWDKRSDYQYS